MALIEVLLAAILFLLTAGFLFYDRFKNNKALMAGAIILAIAGTVSSIYLMREWIEDIVSAKTGGKPANSADANPDANVRTLQPTIRKYVDLAEAAEKEARRAVLEAREVETQIRAVVSKAKSAASTWGWTKIPLTLTWGSEPVEGEYRGDTVTKDGKKIPHGLGVFQAEKMGYTGQWAQGEFDGFGEISFARTGNSLGKWSHGQGVDTGYFFHEGRKISTGKTMNGVRIGVAKTDFGWTPDDPEAEVAGQLSCPDMCYRVQYMVNGTRFAGQFDRTGRNAGALFGSKGDLINQGYWKDEQFIYPIGGR